MKHKVFFYLFLFSSLIIVLLYASNKNMTKAADKRIAVAHDRIDIVRDSVLLLEKAIIEESYFSLKNNDDAQQYFNFQTFEENIKQIEEEILALNHQENGNPLVPYGVIDGNKCIINKVKIINHRWIIADFYSGAMHGEILVKYKFNGNSPTEFSTLETVLYTKQ